MITYCPAYISANHFGYYGFGKQPMDFLPLYEHLARKVLDWKMPYEVLIDTSGINFSAFEGLPSQLATRTLLAKLFLSVGSSGAHGRFLHRLGIRRWADLAKPIRVEGRESKAWYPWREGWDVRERKLREPGPNEYHPKAVYAQRCYFLFCGWKRRWRFVLHYGYSRNYDSHSWRSSWSIEIKQGGEALSSFVNVSVPKWLDSVLEPESDEREREYRNRQHDLLSRAVDCVFGSDYGDSDTKLVNAIFDGRKPTLTARRLGALRRWIAADAKAAAEWVAKQRKGGAS